FRILGAVFFLLVVPANFLLQRRPPLQPGVADQGRADVRLAPPPTTPAVPGAEPPAAVKPTPWRQIGHRPAVWFLVLTRLFASLGSHLTSVHMVAFFVTAGYDPLLAASALAGVGLVSVIGRPLSGALSDILGREVVYTIGLGMHISAIGMVLTL